MRLVLAIFIHYAMLANDVKLAFCPDLTDNNEIKTQKIWEKFLDKNHGNFHKGFFLMMIENLDGFISFCFLEKTSLGNFCVTNTSTLILLDTTTIISSQNGSCLSYFRVRK